MKIFEIATGFTSIPAKIGAATEIVVENLLQAFSSNNTAFLIDLQNKERENINCPVIEIKMPQWLTTPSSFLSVKHKLKRMGYSFRLALKIKRIIRNNPEAVFHFHNQYNFAFTYFFCFFFKKKQKSTRFIYTIHTPLWSQNMADIKQYAPKKYFLEIYSMKRADLVVALNPQMKRNIELFFNHPINGKIVVIPNGVNNKIYHPLGNEKKHSLSFITIGSVCERKNQLETIQVLSPILKKYDTHYYFAGALSDPEYMKRINTFISENDLEEKVTYLKEITPGKALNEIYNQADIYISNSHSEAFSLVLLEAMAAGLPVLLSESFKSSLEGIPATNAISYCNSHEDFQQIIQDLLENNDRIKEISASATAYIDTYFSWEQIANQYEEEIKHLIQKNIL